MYDHVLRKAYSAMIDELCNAIIKEDFPIITKEAAHMILDNPDKKKEFIDKLVGRPDAEDLFTSVIDELPKTYLLKS